MQVSVCQSGLILTALELQDSAPAGELLLAAAPRDKCSFDTGELISKAGRAIVPGGSLGSAVSSDAGLTLHFPT